MVDKFKLVSVIIPVYNVEEYLNECIESVVNQSYKKIEIILIDDGSKDNSGFICDKWVKKDNRIKVFHIKNSGVSSARNYGINLAKGDFIFFLDSDDYIEKGVIEELVLNYKEKYLITINYKRKTKKNCKQNLNIGQFETEKYLYNILLNKNIGVIWGALFDKNIVKKIKFDKKTSFMEDTLFLVEYLKEKKGIQIIDSKNYYIHRLNNNSITLSQERVFKNIENFIYSLNKINNLTNRKYEKLINKKKIQLIEKELRKLKKIKDFKAVLTNSDILNIIKKDKSIFSSIYKLNNAYILKIYYSMRSLLKKIKNIGE